MPIKSLKLINFRNLDELSIEFSEDINIILGDNGCGKTSILEAIYLLSTGRSFRTTNLARIVKINSQRVTINTVISKVSPNNDSNLSYVTSLTSLVEYSRTSSNNIKNNKKLLLNNHPAKSVAEIAAILPVCNIDSTAFHSLSALALQRRRLFDWGVFHVKHGFLAAWRNYSHVLLQRNTLLKKINELGLSSAGEACLSWDELFLESAVVLINLRQQYFDLLEPKFNFYIDKLLPKLQGLIKLTINHGLPAVKDDLKHDLHQNFSIDPGSKAGMTSNTVKNNLRALLTKNLSQDIYRGFTSIGPHRFDIVFKFHDYLAKDLLSRGQEKMLIMALYLAQLDVIKQETGKKCTILIDDLAAELDSYAQELLYQELLAANHQLIISAINQDDIPASVLQKAEKIKMFHVEHINTECS